MGEAMDEVFLSTKPMMKSERDENAFYFLTGFLNSMGFADKYDEETLYNNIDGIGKLVIGPLELAMKALSEEKPLSEKVKYALH